MNNMNRWVVALATVATTACGTDPIGSLVPDAIAQTGNRLEPYALRGSDGTVTSAADTFFDTLLGTTCVLEEYGNPRVLICVPMHHDRLRYGPRGTYTDSGCASETASPESDEELSLAGAETRPVVVDYSPSPVVYDLGDVIPDGSDLYRVLDGACVESEQTSMGLFAIGAELGDLVTFALER